MSAVLQKTCTSQDIQVYSRYVYTLYLIVYHFTRFIGALKILHLKTILGVMVAIALAPQKARLHI